MKLSKIATDIVLYSLLAVGCLGVAELAFCYYADPALFNKLAAPVAEHIEAIADAASEHDAVITQQPVPLADTATAAGEPSQLATAPSLERTEEFADPEITVLSIGKNGSFLTGGNVSLCYYNQSDEAWRDKLFGVDNIGEYGCGPTAMAMVVSSLTQQRINPEQMALWASEQGFASPGHGSYHRIVPDTCTQYGLNCQTLAGIDAAWLREKLAGGGLIVALMGEGHFTASGHFIILRGVTLTGEILVADPNSRENSLMTWDAQQILDELSTATDDGSPLWLITEPAP